MKKSKIKSILDNFCPSSNRKRGPDRVQICPTVPVNTLLLENYFIGKWKKGRSIYETN